VQIQLLKKSENVSSKRVIIFTSKE